LLTGRKKREGLALGIFWRRATTQTLRNDRGQMIDVSRPIASLPDLECRLAAKSF
jgi:hypothetical protein